MPELHKKKIRRKLLVSALVLMTVALSFNAMLSLNSLEKLYEGSIISKYSVVGRDLKRTVERSLKFGKEIDSFLGMQDILNETKKSLIKRAESNDYKDRWHQRSDDLSVSITGLDKKILYSTDSRLINTSVHSEILEPFLSGPKEKPNAQNRLYEKKGRYYYLFIPIMQGFPKKTVAVITIVFNEKQVKDQVGRVLRENAMLIIGILGVGCILLVAALSRVHVQNHADYRLPTTKISLVLIGIVLIGQMVFITINTINFKSYYLKINMEKTRVIITLLKEDIEFFINKGLPIDKLKKMDVMLDRVISSVPELEHIVILDAEGSPLYLADQQGRLDFQENADAQDYKRAYISPDPGFGYTLTIFKGKEKQGNLIAALSKKALGKKLRSMIIDAMTVLAVSILFFVEMMTLFFQYMIRQVKAGVKKRSTHHLAIRPVIFLFLFGMDASISFVPLHMEQLYEPVYGLSKSLVMGLPISIKFLFTAIFVFIGGVWVDKHGWHKPFLFGLVFSGAGLVYAFIVSGALHFIAAMGLLGVGFGLTIISSQGFIINTIDKKKNTQGLSLLFAGAYAGSICGGATGAILADRLGFAPVFAFSAVVIAVTFIAAILTMKEALFSHGIKSFKHTAPKKAVPVEDKDKQRVQPGQVLRFIFDKNVLALICLCSFPAAMAVIGFMNYLCPIYLTDIGVSQATIGRVFMIYGLCLIYIAPVVGKYVDRSGESKKYLILSGLLGVLAFAAYSVFGNVTVVAVTIFLLGLSASCGGAPRRSYILKLPAAKKLGPGKAMGVFNSVTRVGQILGPLVFGWLMLNFDVNTGLTLFGGAYLFAVILFYFIAGDDKRIPDPEIS